MMYENRIETLSRVYESVNDEKSKGWPWIIVCQAQTMHAWSRAASDLLSTDVKKYMDWEVMPKQLIHVDAWLDATTQPHVIVIDEYDPGLRSIVRGLLDKMQKGGHRLFMTRLSEPRPAPNPIVETLDFFKK